MGAPPQSLDDLFGSKTALRIIAEATAFDACVLRHVPSPPRTSTTTGNRIDRYEEGTFVDVPISTVRALRPALLAPKSYVLAGSEGTVHLSKLCYPIYQARLRFKKGKDVVAVDFCFGCGILRTLRDGREINRADFDPSYPLFRNAIVALFPDDPMLQKTRKDKP